jgi:hypothetical protein
MVERQEPAGAGGAAHGVTAQAREQVQELGDRASGQMRTQIDRQSSRLGDQVGSFAEALRRAGQHLELEGNAPAANASRQAASQADRLTRYLRESSPDRLLGDLENMARRRPWLAGMATAAAGFAASRFLKASSEQRWEGSQRSRVDADAPLTRDPIPAPVAPMAPVSPGWEASEGDTRIIG